MPKTPHTTINFISKTARIGRNVKIWHFTYIGDRAEIGDGTRIGSLTHIDYDVKIGKGCKIEGMVYIPPLTVIGDEVFIGPGVIFTNTPYPISDKRAGVIVEDKVIIGAGAVIGAGVRIGCRSVIGMGSVVTKDVPREVVVYGNPAEVRYGLREYLERKRRWESGDRNT